jgi:hypothetical protein
MEYIYRLAGIQIACSLPFSLDICAESREFLELGSAEGDLQLIVEAVDALPPPTGLQVAERYYDGCMRARNYKTVDDANACICYLNGDVRSGTAQTVRYAKKKPIPVINVSRSNT